MNHRKKTLAAITLGVFTATSILAVPLGTMTQVQSNNTIPYSNAQDNLQATGNYNYNQPRHNYRFNDEDRFYNKDYNYQDYDANESFGHFFLFTIIAGMIALIFNAVK